MACYISRLLLRAEGLTSDVGVAGLRNKLDVGSDPFQLKGAAARKLRPPQTMILAFQVVGISELRPSDVLPDKVLPIPSQGLDAVGTTRPEQEQPGAEGRAAGCGQGQLMLAPASVESAAGANTGN